MARGAWIIAPWNGDLCVRLQAEVQRQNVRRQFEKLHLFVVHYLFLNYCAHMAILDTEARLKLFPTKPSNEVMEH